MNFGSFIRPLIATAAIALAVGIAPIAQADEMTGDAMLGALKSGGYVIYFRHAKSDTTQSDADPIKPEDCATQRNLSDAGKAQAKQIGAILKERGIQVDKALASAYCRAKDTASLAFGQAEVSAALFYSLALPKDGAAKAAEDLKKILATAPKSGANTVLVGHTSNLKEVAGVWPKKEGGAYVFQPDGSGGFKLIGQLDPADFDKKAGT